MKRIRVSPAMYLRVKNRSPVSQVITQAVGEDTNHSIGKKVLQLGAAYYQPRDEIIGDIGLSLDVEEGSLHMKRIMGDFIASEGDALRFYPNSRRHQPILATVLAKHNKTFHWEDTILEDTENYLLMNKPAGIPCHASVSNYVDNILWVLQEKLWTKEAQSIDVDHDNSHAAAAASQEVSLSSTPIYAPKVDFYLPQRLDTDTSGLLLIAKSELYISQLGKLLQRKKYRKWYKLLLCYQESSTLTDCTNTLLGKFQIGDELDSFLVKSNIAPKEYLWSSDSCPEGTELQDAKLRIDHIHNPLRKTLAEWRIWHQNFQDNLKQNHSSKHDDLYLSAAMEHWLHQIQRKYDQEGESKANNIGIDEKTVVFQEVTVELLTGRTHQIRGQFQALQRHPSLQPSLRGEEIHIAGDHLYPGLTYATSVQSIDGFEGSSPFLALVSYGIEIDVKIPPSVATTSAAIAEVSTNDNISNNNNGNSSSTNNSQLPYLNRKMKKKNVLHPLKYDLGRCWWSSLYET